MDSYRPKFKGGGRHAQTHTRKESSSNQSHSRGSASKNQHAIHDDGDQRYESGNPFEIEDDDSNNNRGGKDHARDREYAQNDKDSKSANSHKRHQPTPPHCSGSNKKPKIHDEPHDQGSGQGQNNHIFFNDTDSTITDDDSDTDSADKGSDNKELEDNVDHPAGEEGNVQPSNETERNSQMFDGLDGIATVNGIQYQPYRADGVFTYENHTSMTVYIWNPQNSSWTPLEGAPKTTQIILGPQMVRLVNERMVKYQGVKPNAKHFWSLSTLTWNHKQDDKVPYHLIKRDFKRKTMKRSQQVMETYACCLILNLKGSGELSINEAVLGGIKESPEVTYPAQSLHKAKETLASMQDLGSVQGAWLRFQFWGRRHQSYHETHLSPLFSQNSCFVAIGSSSIPTPESDRFLAKDVDTEDTSRERGARKGRKASKRIQQSEQLKTETDYQDDRDRRDHRDHRGPIGDRRYMHRDDRNPRDDRDYSDNRDYRDNRNYMDNRDYRDNRGYRDERDQRDYRGSRDDWNRRNVQSNQRPRHYEGNAPHGQALYHNNHHRQSSHTWRGAAPTGKYQASKGEHATIRETLTAQGLALVAIAPELWVESSEISTQCPKLIPGLEFRFGLTRETMFLGVVTHLSNNCLMELVWRLTYHDNVRYYTEEEGSQTKSPSQPQVWVHVKAPGIGIINEIGEYKVRNDEVSKLLEHCFRVLGDIQRNLDITGKDPSDKSGAWICFGVKDKLSEQVLLDMFARSSAQLETTPQVTAPKIEHATRGHQRSIDPSPDRKPGDSKVMENIHPSRRSFQESPNHTDRNQDYDPDSYRKRESRGNHISKAPGASFKFSFPARRPSDTKAQNPFEDSKIPQKQEQERSEVQTQSCTPKPQPPSPTKSWNGGTDGLEEQLADVERELELLKMRKSLREELKVRRAGRSQQQ